MKAPSSGTAPSGRPPARIARGGSAGFGRARGLPLRVGGFFVAVLLGTAIVSPILVRVVTARTGDAIASWAASLPGETSARAPVPDEAGGADAAAPEDEGSLDASRSAPRPAVTARARSGPAASAATAAPAAPRGILIRERSVLAAIGRGARPSATWVAATDTSPSGLRLGAAPAPFRAGDILVSVGGTKASSEDAIVSAVLGAVKHGARTITGEIDRGGERVPFAVEVPSRFWRSADPGAAPAEPRHRHRPKAARR